MNINFIISIISLAFCLFFFFFFKWYIKRRTSNKDILADIETETYRLIAEINSVTDRNVQLVEDRIKSLKAVLEDADKRLAVYVQELERSRTGEALYTSLGRGIRAALKTEGEAAAEQPADAPAAARHREKKPPAQPKPPAPPATPAGQEVSTQATEPAKPVNKTQSARQIRSQIEALANEGVPLGEIASRLGISIAEVDLAMNLLFRNKNHNGIEKH